jgi:CubicO group peptidase (beta-lactamase class C family)
MKAKLYFVIIFVSLTIFRLPCHAQDAKVMPILNEFGKELASQLNNENLHASISVAVIKNNRIIWLNAYGYASINSDVPADTASIYRIGSITKTFTATLLLQLVQEGKLKLDDPVENYLPEIKRLSGYAHNGPVTFRQLASHTAGLDREPYMDGADVGPLDKWESKLMECIPNTSFNSKPGTAFLYSNMGYAILGFALERITGVPYMQMVQDRIFTPLHMDDTFFALPADKAARLTEGIDNSKAGTINTILPRQELKGRGYRVPNGGIFSTPKDLAKFVMTMIGKPALISEESFTQMQEVPPGGKKYGLGLMLYNNGEVNIIGHNGSVPGYTSQFAIEKQSGYAVILIRNYNTGTISLERTAYNLLKLLKEAE